MLVVHLRVEPRRELAQASGEGRISVELLEI